MADVCVITGSLLSISSLPIPGAVVYASPIVDSNVILDTSTGYYKGLASFPVQSVTNDLGEFSISLIQNSLVRIHIRYISFDEVILVPTTPTAVLWSLVGSKATVIPTSTGDVVIGGGGSAGW